MDIQKEKLQLIEWLIQINDTRLIAQIKALKDYPEVRWNNLSDEEKQAIEEGLAELDEGKGIPHERIVQEQKNRYGL